MKNIFTLINRLRSDDSGQDLIEYALLASLVGLAAVTILGTLSTDIVAVFTKIGTQLNPTS